MSSPIHKYLFSPPPSPPSRGPRSSLNPNRGLTTLKSLLLPSEFIPQSSLDDHVGSPPSLKTRSPHTPQQGRFTFDTSAYSSFGRGRRGNGYYAARDLESIPESSILSPSQQVSDRKLQLAPPINIVSPASHSRSFQSALTVPKPILRLFFLVCIIFTTAAILIFVPSARPPSLFPDNIAEQTAFVLEDHYVDVDVKINVNALEWKGMGEGREYEPPLMKAAWMLKGVRSKKQTEVNKDVQEVKEVKKAKEIVDVQTQQLHAAPPPKTTRPALRPRPIPASHELLALQSYILASQYNVLSENIDPSKPLDANTILGISASERRFGGVAGLAAKKGKEPEEEEAWLKDIESEWDDEVVVWFGGNGQKQLPHDVIDIITSSHSSNRHITYIPLYSRPDREIILSILARLGLPADSPIIMIDNEPILGDLETLEELRLSGELERRLSKIGWKKTSPQEERTGKKLKMAVIKKKENGMIEEVKKLAGR
ncbi:hypothetical protein CNBG_6146 [Cryptococcus deuterogattii R265]|uniref:Uncharacterized protein n=1 Tax=Cryptococcus deuterogattii (strain R265) TaxID=294750 RepID=A0A095EU80_CRYD2|nr:hypothetical protein CNBG_6146 [Cryptococcus deuterogattii R265]KIR25023.1 hypothetical protein I309_06133 [Cryptococcus deuterogattii LA55]KIR71600.1 hypothetical protein I310_04907 [Cryptococcus deuterogattii CA1014]KIR91181.1 hypothetical protein I304_05277 [Cryptococcus deuterogattii CBS 10090]KIR96356.1 hypothetical protein L804_06191 [Cryptococcus deuterogattii 2001/935-1]